MINNCWFCLDEQDDPCSGCSSCGKYSMLFIVTKIKIFIVSKILQLILIKNAKAVKYFQISKETIVTRFSTFLLWFIWIFYVYKFGSSLQYKTLERINFKKNK